MSKPKQAAKAATKNVQREAAVEEPIFGGEHSTVSVKKTKLKPAKKPRTAEMALKEIVQAQAESVSPAAAPVENKRITPGAKVKEWRVVRSLRKEFQGWFLQGGTVSAQSARSAVRRWGGRAVPRPR
jgi:hypothetical protein